MKKGDTEKKLLFTDTVTPPPPSDKLIAKKMLNETFSEFLRRILN